MRRIGMVVAVEIDAVLKKYKGGLTHIECDAFDIKQFNTDNYILFIVTCGVGEIAAAAATQYLISEYNVDLIVNFGVVGGLTHEMAVAKICVVKSVVHYDFDTSAYQGCEKARYLQYPSIYIPTTCDLVETAVRIRPELKVVVCASGDKFVAEERNKRDLHDEFGADICEMEAAGIVLTCNRNNVPCLLIKAVSDAMDGGAEEFTREVDRCAEICLDTVGEILDFEGRLF